ncbi:hypothetical protein KAR91_72040 [Candidatus Pacearchaeota archaeon]|nr:hypothetical protein [Candidatus Pacearchaeota archaeon]
MSKEDLFPIGQVVATNGVGRLMRDGIDITEYLDRHRSGDWGDLDPEDQVKQAYSLRHGFMLLSVYKISDSVTLWIKTEYDRSVTTLMLPTEW